MSENGAMRDGEGMTPKEWALHERFQNLLALEQAVRDMIASRDKVEQLLGALAKQRPTTV